MSSVTKKLMNATIGLVLVGLILMTNLSFAQEEGGYGSQIRSPHRKLLQVSFWDALNTMQALNEAAGLAGTAVGGSVTTAFATANQANKAAQLAATNVAGTFTFPNGKPLPGGT